MSNSRKAIVSCGGRSCIRLITVLLGLYLVAPFYIIAHGQPDRHSVQSDPSEFPIYFVNVTKDVLVQLDSSSLYSGIGAAYSTIMDRFSDAQADGFDSLGFYWIASDMLCKLYGVRANTWMEPEQHYVTLDGCITNDIDSLLDVPTRLKLAVQDVSEKNIVTLAEQMRDAGSNPAILFSGDQIDVSELDFDGAEVFPAGPEAFYIRSVAYHGKNYDALIRYPGGTTASLEQVYAYDRPMPSFRLSQTELSMVSSDALEISNVEVNGVGYAAAIEYAGGNQLRVTDIHQVTLPPIEAELAQAADAAAAEAHADADAAVSAALAAADAAMAEAAAAQAAVNAAQATASAAMADATAANTVVADLRTQVKKLTEGIPLADINPDLLNLESARITIAGPDSIYISGIQYAGKAVSTRVRYSQGTGTAEAVFESTSDLADVLNMHAAQVDVVDDALVVSNVSIRGLAHTLTLTFNDNGGVDISARDDGWAVRTVGELHRDKLITEGTYLVSGLVGGKAIPNEGAWSKRGGTVVQTDSSASHAKYTIPAVQSGSEMLFGVTAKADDSDKVGFGLHFLAAGASNAGSTEGYGRSYLCWVTHDLSYGTAETYLKLFESRDDSTLLPLVSWRIDQTVTLPLTIEALYQERGVITLFVDGEEQFTMNVNSTITTGDRIALRARGGPVEFTQVYVASRQ